MNSALFKTGSLKLHPTTHPPNCQLASSHCISTSPSCLNDIGVLLVSISSLKVSNTVTSDLEVRSPVSNNASLNSHCSYRTLTCNMSQSDASSITSNPAVCRSLGHPASSASYDPWSKESIGRPVDENGLDRDALGDSREDVTRLPPTQSPYVTLLKKNRGRCLCSSQMIFCQAVRVCEGGHVFLCCKLFVQ